MVESKRDDSLNIYQRMRLATDSIGVVAKKLRVAGQYNAVGEVDVLEAVKEAESTYGIYSYPEKRTVLLQDVIELNADKIPHMVVRIETTYRFVNLDKPEDYISVVSYGTGIDKGDKDVGKAMTYADKYALLKAYKVETGVDPDKDPSPENGYKKVDKVPTPPAKNVTTYGEVKPKQTPIQPAPTPIVNVDERAALLAECRNIYDTIFNDEQRNQMNDWLNRRVHTSVLTDLSIEDLKTAHRAFSLTRDKIVIDKEKNKRKEDAGSGVVPSDELPF